MYGIVRGLRDYSPKAREKISHEVKSSILWIMLLQSRRYAQGKMEGNNACLGEFTNVVNLKKSKKLRNDNPCRSPDRPPISYGKRTEGAKI